MLKQPIVKHIPYCQLLNQEERFSMYKSILVLEESRMVHDLFDSALPDDYVNWDVFHESTPDNYVQKATETNPDIIFLSNQDQNRNYATVKQLKASPVFDQTPILLLTSAKDKLDEHLLQTIGVRGFVRKPFETSTLHKQINQVLKEQERQKKKKPSDRLKDVNVVDDDLMNLLSGKDRADVSVNELEGELDPTLQLIPEDEMGEEETETELLPMEDGDSLIQAEFIEEDEEEEPFDMAIEDVLADTEEIELEAIDDNSDFMDLDDDSQRAVDLEPPPPSAQQIEVVQGDISSATAPLSNTPENFNDLGFMELHVVPLRSQAIKSHVVDEFTEDFDEEAFVRKHSPAELESEYMTADPEEGIESAINDSGDIEIPHEEIIEDINEADIPDDETEEAGLMELSIEGLDNDLDSSLDEGMVAFEELDDNDPSIEEVSLQDEDRSMDSEDDLSMVSQEDLEPLEDDITTVELDEGIDVEVDFQSDPTADILDIDEPGQLFDGLDEDEVDEDSLTESELEKRRSDQLDVDLEEIAAAGTEEASSTIQEMIGFRQVMKAKYELPDDELGIEPEEDSLDNELSEDDDLLAEVEKSMASSDEEDSDDSFDMDDLESGEDEPDLEPVEDEEDLMMDVPEAPESGELDDSVPEIDDLDLEPVGDEGDLLEDSPEPLRLGDLDDGGSEIDDLDLKPVGDDDDLSIDAFDTHGLGELDESEADIIDIDISPMGDEDSLLMEDDEDQPLNFEAEDEEDDLLADLPEPPSLDEDMASSLEEDSPLESFEEPDEVLTDVPESIEADDDIELLSDDVVEVSDQEEIDFLTEEVETDTDTESLEDIDLLTEEGDDSSHQMSLDEPKSFEEVDLMELNQPEESDSLFEEPDDSPEDIFESPDESEPDSPDSIPDIGAEDDDIDTLAESIDMGDSDETDFMSLDDDDSVQDDPFEEISLSSDMEEEGMDSNEDEVENLLEASDEPAFDPFSVDEDDSDEDLLMEVPDDPLAMDSDLSDEDSDLGTIDEDAMEEIDFMPIDEEEKNGGESFERGESDLDDDSLEDIDFLPVDENDIDTPEESDEDAMGMPADLDLMPDESEEENDSLLAMDDVESLDDADDITIEVPQDTFEMGDFSVSDITGDESELEDDEEADSMEGIEAEEPDDEWGAATESESFDDIDLPTMDEDLPDLPPISDEGRESDAESPDIHKLSEEEKDSDIQLLQDESDFEDFEAEDGIIGVVDSEQTTAQEPTESEEAIKQQTKIAAASFTPEFQRKLTEMIEGMVSESVQHTLHQKLPQLVEKLMKEEIGD